MRGALDGCGTEDLGLAVRLAYAYVLSPTAVLSEAETSFVMIAGLVPQDVSLEWEHINTHIYTHTHDPLSFLPLLPESQPEHIRGPEMRTAYGFSLARVSASPRRRSTRRDKKGKKGGKKGISQKNILAWAASRKSNGT